MSFVMNDRIDKTRKAAVLLWLVAILLGGCSAFLPKETGLKDGKLRPCPPAPKCVSSYYKEGIHHIEPLNYTGSKEEAYGRVIDVLRDMGNAKIIVREPDYIHAEFEVSDSLGWSDDVEFLFDEETKTIHYSSSASAGIGFWDWNKNRRRAREIRRRFNK